MGAQGMTIEMAVMSDRQRDVPRGAMVQQKAA